MNELSSWAFATDYAVLDILALSLLMLSAFSVIILKDLLSSALMLGIFSLLMGLIYLLLDAPDVALTEAAVGAGISTVLFLGSLVFIGRVERRRSQQTKVLPLLAVVIVGALLIYASQDLPAFSDRSAPIHQHVAPYYIEHMASDIGIPNLVTAILASYRGFDTMGEVAVIFTAGLGICLLLMNQPAAKPDEDEDVTTQSQQKGKKS